MMTNSEILPPASPQRRLTNRWGWLPLFALCGGVWVYAPSGGTLPYTNGLMALALLLGGWWPWWEALVCTDWATALAQWQAWEEVGVTVLLPYTQAATPGAALAQTISQAHHWWRSTGRLALQGPLRQAWLALLVSLLLAVLQGRLALLFTLLFVTWSELAVLWHGGKGLVGSGWAAFALVGIPWLLGASLSAGTMGTPAIAGLTLTLLVGFHAHTSPLAGIGPLIGAAFLIWQGQPLAAGALLLLAVPGLNLLRQRPLPADYQRSVLPWLLAMLLVTAGVL